ncbi:LuxR C-terminal-related transcriptional regulator [Nocardia sp. NPDC059177]|uniref:helix-turn-helix transcriptional regulator n=1 Tax=Nocardia sp. NPDC059177 TaxID=3346759 RepID=UPI0036AAE5D7
MSESIVSATADGATPLRALRDVLVGPLPEIARRFSRLLAARWPHSALVIFTHECTGRPRKVAGAASVVDRITIGELDDVKSVLDPGSAAETVAAIGGVRRKVWAVRDPTDTLLVLVPRAPAKEFTESAELAALFGIVATSIRHQVTQASPDYLAESRAASSERARTIAELTASHESALVAVLHTLRSRGLDDTTARLAAADSASRALLALRSMQHSDRELSEEPAATAFSRLRKETRQLLRHHPAQVDYVPPVPGDVALPGEIASAALAMTRATVLAFTTQPALTRVRIAWTCAGSTLTIDVRDQESGELDTSALRHRLQDRCRTLGGELRIETVAGWGSRVGIDLPLHAPAAHPGTHRLAALNKREREVLALISAGKRNKSIADELGIAESTVKFHVAGVLRKLDVTSRGEAAALGRPTTDTA